MGNIVDYRPTPRRIHTTEEGRSPFYEYGVSQITGWRYSQEDRYICLPKFHEDFSMFAVYDGHGGGHAVQYLYRFMHQHILKELIRHKDPELALYLGFVTTDLCLRNITNKELEVIDDDLDLEFEVPDQGERRHVIFQFQNRSGESAGTSKNDSSAASNVPGTSQGTSEHDFATQDLKAEIASACISQLKSVKFLTQDEMEVDESDEEYDPDKDNIKLNYFEQRNEDEEEDEESSESEESVDDEDLAEEPSGNEQSGDVDEEKESFESKEIVDDQNLAKKPSGNEEQSGKKEDSEYDANTRAEQSQDCEEESKKIDNSVVEISETSTSECSTEESPSKCVDLNEPDDKFCERTGSTATVVLLNGSKIYIANVGDSRCVACMDGQAVDLSVDHKPTLKEEKRRIYNAGGFLKDDRVLGVLDMSRTFGDFEFKKKNVAEPFQMLSCEPFITSLEITDKLEFLIIASDGIWNTMESEEVIEYLKNRIQDTHMELQDICGEMFELILPKEATNDGTGCDNLTAILIVFKKQTGYSTPIAGLQECYTYNYSPWNRKNNLQGKKSTSVQKSTSPSLNTEKIKNKRECPPASEDHCMLETDDNYVPLEPIPIRSPSIHSDNEDARPPSKRFKSHYSSINCKQLDPRNSYYTHDNSQTRPLNLARHAGDICDDNYEPGHSEGSKYAEEPSVTDHFLNCFQDLRNFIEITREKIKIVDNDLRAAINEMDVKLTGLLKHPEFAHHFGGHSYFSNLNNIQARTNNLFQFNLNIPSTFSNPNALLNSEHFIKPFSGYDTQSTYADTLPSYVGIQPTYVETQSQRKKSASNQKASQSTSGEVLVVDLSSDEDENLVGDNSGATQVVDEESSAVDNSGAIKEVNSCNALQVSQKSTEKEPLREKDRMKILSTEEELKKL